LAVEVVLVVAVVVVVVTVTVYVDVVAFDAVDLTRLSFSMLF